VVVRRPDLHNPFAKLSGCLDGCALDISLQLSLPVKVKIFNFCDVISKPRQSRPHQSRTIYFVRKTKREWGREIRKLVENVLKTHGDKPGVATQARLTVMGTVTAAMLAAAG
jgi:hypothetical protein